MRGLSNASGARLALLFLVIGTCGGALGGGAVGVWLGQRLRPAAVRSRTASTPLPKPTEPKAPASPVQDAGARTKPDGGSAASEVPLCVEVRDSGERPVLDATVGIRALPPPARRLRSAGPAGKEDQPEVGELGVYSAPLPYPEDIIAGQYVPLGRAKAPHAAGPQPADGVRTDEHGRACLKARAPGYFELTASREARSASVELSLLEAHGPALSQGSPISIVLRLAEPLDSICRPAAQAAPLVDAPPGEPASSAVGPDVIGRVVDGRGFGLAAARIEAQVGDGRARVVAVSDGSGSFRLAGLPRGALLVRAQLAGYAPLTINRRADEPRDDLQLVLRPGGGIAGTLRDARRGTLPPGAQLVVVPAVDGAAISVPLRSDGSFSATGLPVGSATLRARAPGYAPLFRTMQVPAADSPAQVSLRDLRLELEAGGSLAGQVRGAAGEAAGVTIQVYDDSGAAAGKALADEHGEFRLGDLPAGRLRVTASSGHGRAEAVVELRSGDEERVYLELR